MYQKWTGPLLSEKRSDVGMIFAGIRFVPAFTDGIVRLIFARQDPDPFLVRIARAIHSFSNAKTVEQHFSQYLACYILVGWASVVGVQVIR